MKRRVFLTLVWLAAASAGSSQTVLRMGPENGKAAPGGTVSIGIRVENVTALHLVHLFLGYDSTVLRFESASVGALMVGAFFHRSKGVRNGSASLLLDAALLGREASVSGSGTICSVRFSGIGKGLSRLTGEDIQLLDTTNRVLPCKVVEGAVTVEDPSGIGTTRGSQSPDFYLGQNYPNPFNSVTTIEYGLAKESSVTLEVYDVLGRLVAGLGGQNQKAKIQRFQLDGSGLPSGEYFYRIRARAADGSGGSSSGFRKLVILR